MKLSELRNEKFMGLKVIVSWTFNKGYEWEDLLKAPDYESEWVWESEIQYFTKTPLYDLVIKIGA